MPCWLTSREMRETLGDLAWRRTQEPPFIKRLVNDPLLQHIKLIAEPWDCAWPDGSFGSRWLVPKLGCGLSGGLVPIKRWSKYFHVSRIWCEKKHLYSRVCFFTFVGILLESMIDDKRQTCVSVYGFGRRKGAWNILWNACQVLCAFASFLNPNQMFHTSSASLCRQLVPSPHAI